MIYYYYFFWTLDILPSPSNMLTHYLRPSAKRQTRNLRHLIYFLKYTFVRKKYISAWQAAMLFSPDEIVKGRADRKKIHFIFSSSPSLPPSSGKHHGRQKYVNNPATPIVLILQLIFKLANAVVTEIGSLNYHTYDVIKVKKMCLTFMAPPCILRSPKKET